MIIDWIPGWLLFLVVCGVVFASVEVGFRLGRTTRRKAEDERESSVSSMAGVILSVLAFLIAFTFDMVSDRYEVKKSLVREEANVIRTTWNRADLLPEEDRAISKALLTQYLERRIDIAIRGDAIEIRQSEPYFVGIQQQLWVIAAANARLDMNSDIGAMYVDSINQLAEIHATRFGVGLNSRVPTAIWLSLLSLLILGMLALGYQCAIADSRRPRVTPSLAAAFALIVVLIASLDNPGNAMIPIPQDALTNVLSVMKAQSIPPR